MNEELIITKTLEHLPDEIQVNETKQHPDKGLDCIFFTNIKGKEDRWNVEVKREIRQLHLKTLEDLNQKYENFLLVAYRLFPGLKQQLREKDINYIEANGNLYLHKGDLFIYIDTYPALSRERETGNRAFTKAGLKVLFQLLLDWELINQPQRDIADRADVALGNIPKVLRGIQEAGFILKYDVNTYRYTDKEALIDKWVREYALNLRPNLVEGKFHIAGNQPWQDINLKKGLTLWGGEPAGDILTQYLRPEQLTLYTLESREELIKNYRLIPDTKGDVEVLAMFWKPEDRREGTVPPLLVYADLINTNDKRCAETAQLIFEKYVRPGL